MQRTQTAAPPSEDFQTWDLARILAETSKHFDKALESADILKKVPIENTMPCSKTTGHARQLPPYPIRLLSL